MSTKSFTFGTSGSTGATGVSNPVSAPNPYKAVVCKLAAGSTGATVLVHGSIDGGVTKVLLDTLTLSGSGGVDEYHDTNAFDTISLQVTAITGTVSGKIRYAHN